MADLAKLFELYQQFIVFALDLGRWVLSGVILITVQAYMVVKAIDYVSGFKKNVMKSLTKARRK